MDREWCITHALQGAGVQDEDPLDGLDWILISSSLTRGVVSEAQIGGLR